MIEKKFLGIEITDNDDYGTVHLRLALDLLASIRQQADDKIVEEKARNIVQVCCEPMFDGLIREYDWNPDESAYAEKLLVCYSNLAVTGLTKLAKRRIKHTRKHERRTKLQIDDLKVGAIMAYVMNLPDLVEDQIEVAFLADHGAMNFSR